MLDDWAVVKPMLNGVTSDSTVSGATFGEVGLICVSSPLEKGPKGASGLSKHGLADGGTLPYTAAPKSDTMQHRRRDTMGDERSSPIPKSKPIFVVWHNLVGMSEVMMPVVFYRRS